MERERRPRNRNQSADDALFTRLLRKYRKNFEMNTLPEIRKRMYYLTPTQARKVKDRKAKARRKKEERKSQGRQNEQREDNQDS